MGARTTWEIVGENGVSMFLYSHWGGDTKWEDTVEALRTSEPRWMDESYGARIFMSTIIGEDWSKETGFGISAGTSGMVPFEEEFFPIKLNFSTQTISLGVKSKTNPAPFLEYTFEQFVNGVGDSSHALVEAYWA